MRRIEKKSENIGKNIQGNIEQRREKKRHYNSYEEVYFVSGDVYDGWMWYM